MPFMRILSNKITSILLSLKTKQKIIDSQCGFRAYRSEVIKKVKTTSNGYEAESEILILASRMGFNIGFIEIPTVYADEKSKIKPFAVIFGFLRILFRWSMAKKIKWQIESLKYSKQLKKSANTILSFRIESLISIVERYFKDQTVENLHDVRIAIRRVRYSMELFLICYNKKDFMRFYNKIQKLQDISGSVRDMDITIENVDSLIGENTILNNDLIQKAKENKVLLEQLFNLELAKFIHGKTFKDFYKQNFSKGDRYEN